MRVVISGQMPPPVGGQNLNVKRFYDLLAEEKNIQAEHWRMEFTKSTKSFRKFGIGKVVEFVRVVFRLFVLRLQGKIDVIIYSTGGPHLIPIIRDIVLLPLACLISKKVWVHFQAAGIADKLISMNPLLRGLLKGVHRLCYGGIALSSYGREDPKALAMSRIEVLSNGLEDHASGHKFADTTAGSNSKNGVLLYVGHLCQDKGVPDLIKAFSSIAKSNPYLRLKLVGQCLTPYTHEQLALDVASSGVSGQIEVVGLLMGKDLDQAYHESDIVVFPSVAPYESFGLVLVEAMIWGKPIIACDWRAASEVVGNLNQGGVCYKIENSHAMALERAIRHTLKMRGSWQEWGVFNRLRYENLFSIDCLRRNLLKIINL